MKLRVSHFSRYEYAQTVSFSPHTLYFRPRETPILRVIKYKLNVAPSAKLTEVRDVYENSATVVHFWDRADALNLRVELEVENVETNPFDFLLRFDATKIPFSYDSYEHYMLTPYLQLDAVDARPAAEWLRHHRIHETDTLRFLTELNQTLCSELAYRPPQSDPTRSVSEILTSGGSSRDFATATIAILRELGLAARFVNGYLYTLPDDERHTPSAMHAWVEVYLPGGGWRGFDPTHGVFCTDAYIPVAHAPIAECVSPVQGSYYSSVHVPSTLQANVLVEKLA